MLVMLACAGSLRLLFESQVVCRVKNGQVNRQVRQLPGLFEDESLFVLAAQAFQGVLVGGTRGTRVGPSLAGPGGNAYQVTTTLIFT
jgi:hypothetical protein